MQPADEEFVLLTEAVTRYGREVGPCTAYSRLRAHAAQRGRISLGGEEMPAYKVHGRWTVRRADLERAINAEIPPRNEQAESVADPDELLKAQFLASLGSGRRIGDIKRHFGQATYDRAMEMLVADRQIEILEPQEIEEERHQQDAASLRARLRTVRPAWWGRLLSVTPGIALVLGVFGCAAVVAFLLMAVDGLLGDTSFNTSFRWANPLFQWSVVALVAGTLALMYLVVLEYVALDTGTEKPGLFRLVGRLLLSLILVVPLIVATVLWVVIAHLIHKPDWSDDDQFIVRPKPNEAPPR